MTTGLRTLGIGAEHQAVAVGTRNTSVALYRQFSLCRCPLDAVHWALPIAYDEYRRLKLQRDGALVAKQV
jgi:hypothetical protein